MPQNNAGHVSGNLKAGADLSAKQFFALKLDTNGDVILATAATDVIVGVLLNKPKSGEAAEVAEIGGGGIVQLSVDGSGTAIAIGDRLTSDANGRGVKTTTSTHSLIGTARQASSALADLVDCHLGVPGRNI